MINYCVKHLYKFSTVLFWILIKSNKYICILSSLIYRVHNINYITYINILISNTSMILLIIIKFLVIVIFLSNRYNRFIDKIFYYAYILLFFKWYIFHYIKIKLYFFIHYKLYILFYHFFMYFSRYGFKFESFNHCKIIISSFFSEREKENMLLFI